MKRITTIAFCLLLIAFKPVRAETGQSYNQFVTNYRQYQNSLSPFNVAKSKYLAYKSVIAQGEFLEAARNLISAELASMLNFNQFLIDYFNEANRGLKLSENVTLIKLTELQNQLVTLANQQSAVDSLEAAQRILTDMATKYDQLVRLAYWTKATVESAGVKKVYDNLGIEKPKLGSYLNQLDMTKKENQAAVEKYTSLETAYNTIATGIASAFSLQAGFTDDKAEPKETEIASHKALQKTVLSLESLVLGYQNILFAVKND